MVNVLIVYAHPEPQSFTHALKEKAVQTLLKAGHKVEVSDLYFDHFNPVAGRHDFKLQGDPSKFHYQSEQLYASEHDHFSDDIAREQEKLLNLDLCILVFPLWWGGMPAILKGWFDRVLAYGVAYSDGQRFSKGYFKKRRGIIALTTGGTKQRFSTDDVYGSIDKILYPINRCMLEYMGLDVYDPFIAYASPRVSLEERLNYLKQWEHQITNIANDVAWHEELKIVPTLKELSQKFNNSNWNQ
ncbi:NAD(P)H-dependent oxidoreductase [Psychrobacillus sp. FJAT-51614]|uniref:NAD(P)H-dependent oxidoreductase n=1 Tax=Psychrobacillus mangrovi TaxID=3117745 RepID=A0ABU8F4X4_9BACI